MGFSVVNSSSHLYKQGSNPEDARGQEWAGGRYTGPWLNGKPHGWGRYIDSEGQYNGQFEEGKPQGNGFCVYSNGDRYDGEWLDGEPHGEGVRVCSDGNRYEGEWLHGEPHGQGVLAYSNGDRYEGEWLNGELHGQGVRVYANGDRYEGEWRKGKRCGQGVCTYSNGDRYEGEWLNDTRSGKGVYIYSCEARYEGEWLNGMHHGTGVYIYNSEERHEGKFSNGVQHGWGVYERSSGVRFKGEWVQGEKQGLFTLENGEESLKIEFKNDMMIPRDEGIAVEHTTVNPSNLSHALIIESTDDHNGVFSDSMGLEVENGLRKLVRGEVTTIRVDSVEKLTQIDLEERYRNRISHLWIRAHGSPEGLCFGQLAIAEHFRPLLRQLDPSAVIVLESCSTGRVSPNQTSIPIAQQLANSLQTATVIAPNCDIFAIGLSGLNDGMRTTTKVAMIGHQRLKGNLNTFTATSSL